MDRTQRKSGGYNLGEREGDREWFSLTRKSKGSANGSSTTPTRTSTLATTHTPEPLERDLANPKPPDTHSYNPTYADLEQIPRESRKTSELIAEAKLRGIGARSASPSFESSVGPAVTTSPSSSSASLLRKSLSKLPALRLPDVKSLFPTWQPPRLPASQPSNPPSFFDGPMVEEELEPPGQAGSDPPSPSQQPPQLQGSAWASTPLDFSSRQLVDAEDSIDPFSMGLSCKFSTLFPMLVQPHILVNPVSLQCCGLCMCRTCVANVVASPSLLCSCGAPITASVLERALAAPSNQALTAILSIIATRQPPQ